MECVCLCVCNMCVFIIVCMWVCLCDVSVLLYFRQAAASEGPLNLKPPWNESPSNLHSFSTFPQRCIVSLPQIVAIDLRTDGVYYNSQLNK